jgi:hypothetical protein
MFMSLRFSDAPYQPRYRTAIWDLDRGYEAAGADVQRMEALSQVLSLLGVEGRQARLRLPCGASRDRARLETAWISEPNAGNTALRPLEGSPPSQVRA